MAITSIVHRLSSTDNTKGEKVSLLTSLSGAKSRGRTGDISIFSAALYQLSYLGVVIADGRFQIGDCTTALQSEIFNLQSFLVGDDGLEPPTSSV